MGKAGGGGDGSLMWLYITDLGLLSAYHNIFTTGYLLDVFKYLSLIMHQVSIITQCDLATVTIEETHLCP